MWLDAFRSNPIVSLIECNDLSVSLSAQRDLLDKPISLEKLWELPESQKILKKQRKNGSWEYLGVTREIRTKEGYNQIETYRNLGYLIEKFSFTKNHPAIQNAAEYLLKFQTGEGDFRGIYGNQYSPNYSAGITELLIKAGYERDIRIKKVFEWLISIRQLDGGWALPFRTRNFNLNSIYDNTKTIIPDLAMPCSHMITGVVLRAFAAHSSKKKSSVAKDAGRILLSALFKKDKYPDRAGAGYWLRFTFPFLYTDLISALDTLSQLGFSKQDPEIEKALHWLVTQQNQHGTWALRITKGENKDIVQAWLGLAICKIFKRLLD